MTIFINKDNASTITASEVEDAIEDGADVNEVDYDDDSEPTPLINAVKYGASFDVIKALIENDAEIDETDETGACALLLACQQKDLNIKVVELLLDNDADVNLQGEEYQTPFISSMKYHPSNAKLLKLIMDNDPEELEETDDNAPIFLALKYGCSAEIVELLMDNGASMNTENDEEETPYMLAIENNRPDILKIFLDNGLDANTIDDRYESTLINNAVTDAGGEVLRLLVEHGADVHDDTGDEPPIINACEWTEYPDVIEVLVENGVDLNKRYGDSETLPLWEAVTHNANPEVIRTLIRLGAEITDPEALIKDGSRFNDNIEVIKVLKQIINGESAESSSSTNDVEVDAEMLHGVADGDDYDRLKKLLEQDSSNIEARDDEGRTPLMIAMENLSDDSPKLVSVLLEAGANVEAKDEDDWTVLIQACEEDIDIAKIKLLLKAGADVNYKTEDGLYTPLTLALTQYADSKAVNVLVKGGADVNLALKNGKTPLMCATTSLKSLKAILKYDVDVNAKDDSDLNALMHVVGHLGSDVLKKIKLLIDHKADLNQPVYGNKNMLENMVKHWYNQTEIIELLLENGVKPDTDLLHYIDQELANDDLPDEIGEIFSQYPR